MFSPPLIYDDCCLLTNIDLNSQRIYYILERRFKSNSNKTSFDFKSFLPEQPSNNAKVSRSLLRFQPKLKFRNDSEDNISTDVSSSEEEEEDNEEVLTTNDDDDYLNKLAEWEPDSFLPIMETDDEDENIPQSIITENNNEDNQTSLMEHSSDNIEDTPSTPVEDLLVTFIHRPVKTEPINHRDHVFDNPPQLDGHMDASSPKSSTQSKPNDAQKRLDEAIAKVLANAPTPNKTIQLHQIPLRKNQFRLNDEIKKKPTNQTPTTYSSISSKLDRFKEQAVKDFKPIKKTKSRLLSTVLKTNGDIIRPLCTPISSNQITNQKPSRSSSDTRLQSTSHKPKDQRKILSNEERISFQQPSKSSSFINNQKGQPQSSQSSSQPKEKSASAHMTKAERKLNHFQKHQQSKSSVSETSSSKINTNLSATKSKPKENIKSSFKLSKSIDSHVQKPESIPKRLHLSEHNQQVKKKVKKLKRLDTEQSQTQDNLSSKNKKQKSMEDFVIQKQQLISHQSEPSAKTTNSDGKTNKRPADFFKGCIQIDDDDDDNAENNKNDTEDDNDIQEIERLHYSIAYDIRTREKLLDHPVHSSVMHIKWLFNLEYLLLEHILICHENNIRPLNKTYENSVTIKNEFPINSSVYQIDPSFISIIIINFLKMFILRNSSNDQQEVSFNQFGLTSHLRYLLIELPTYNHNEEKDLNENCSKCHQYSLIINILFDLLFDLIEHDLCEINSKTKYRSSLIEDDYFTRFLQSKLIQKDTFYRIKLLIYFIELIGIHMNKCQNKKQFQFNKNENKLFHSIEDFIRHIISHINNSINQRISICFNVMELCLLFVNEKQIRIKQMAIFLAELCENNLTYLNVFLFDKNLLVDIRLLLINEFISKKYHIKFISIDYIKQFIAQEVFNSVDSIDESVLLLVRGLFNTYADLIIEIKVLPLMYSNLIQGLTLILQEQLGLVFKKLIEISSKNESYFQQIKRTLMVFRLLKCKWNKL